jgi:hypothetical protein
MVIILVQVDLVLGHAHQDHNQVDQGLDQEVKDQNLLLKEKENQVVQNQDPKQKREKKNILVLAPLHQRKIEKKVDQFHQRKKVFLNHLKKKEKTHFLDLCLHLVKAVLYQTEKVLRRNNLKQKRPNRKLHNKTPK